MTLKTPKIGKKILCGPTLFIHTYIHKKYRMLCSKIQIGILNILYGPPILIHKKYWMLCSKIGKRALNFGWISGVCDVQEICGIFLDKAFITSKTLSEGHIILT